MLIANRPASKLKYTVFREEECKAGAEFVGLVEAEIDLRRTEASCLHWASTDAIGFPPSSNFIQV